MRVFGISQVLSNYKRRLMEKSYRLKEVIF